jgi:hypothetical protein
MKTFTDFRVAMDAFQAHRPMFSAAGIHLTGARSYVTDAIKRDWRLACDHASLLGFDGRAALEGFDPMALDALPTLSTEANSAIPAFLTTLIDPEVYEILFAPTKAAEIFGEKQKGTWVDQTAMFPVVEQTGEVSSYGDFNENGRSGANMNWPQRQAYLFQSICEYGELEVARAGLGRVNWVSEIDKASTTVLARFMNSAYFRGVVGLQNYGILNDPNLSAALTPSTKAAGGTKWVNNGVIVATANEIYADIQSLYLQLIKQTAGLVDKNSKMTLALSPQSEFAMTATNSFGVNVEDLVKKNLKNLRVVSAVQYGGQSSTNPVGNPAGELVQLIVDDVEGQDTGYCAFNEKLRTHPIVRQLSSWKKKMTSGVWGAILRMPMGIAQMVGV